MITFQYPAYTPTNTLILGSPEKDDSSVLEGQMQIVLTRDNTQRSYVKKAETKILELEFTHIKTEKRDQVANFFRGLGSNYLRYIDYIPRPIPDSELFTFDNWILNLLDEIQLVSVEGNKYEFSIVAERWSTAAL